MSAASNSKLTPLERFWSKVDKSGPVPDWRPDLGPCWLWTDALVQGYGQFFVRVDGKSKRFLAHRWSYATELGAIPDDLPLDHLCRVRNCVRPSHLEPVTHAENLRRSPLIVKDACVAGHPYVEGSYYLDRGRRACKECKKAQVAAYSERTGRSTATYVCPHCGEMRNLTARSSHLKRVHPEHYTPRQPSEGLTPERHQRRLELQRARRAKAAEAMRSQR